MSKPLDLLVRLLIAVVVLGLIVWGLGITLSSGGADRSGLPLVFLGAGVGMTALVLRIVISRKRGS